MPRWKSAWSICPQCRMQLLSAAMNKRAFSSHSITAASTFRKAIRLHPQSWRFREAKSLWLTSKLRSEQKAASRSIDTQDAALPRKQFSNLQTVDEDVAPNKTQYTDRSSLESEGVRATPEEMAQAARNFFGDSLPHGALSSEEFAIYRRMYGEPSAVTTEHLQLQDGGEHGNVLLRDNGDGTVDEFEYVEEVQDDHIVDDEAELDEEDAIKDEDFIHETTLSDHEIEEMDSQRVLRNDAQTALTFGESQDRDASAKTRARDEILEDIYDRWPEYDVIRSHPFTDAGKFGTKPSTVQLPNDEFVLPVKAMLTSVSNKHLSEAAQKVLGGVGIPDSPSTPAIGRNKGQRPVPLTAMQNKMSPMEANVFVTSIMPQIYASAVSVLVECRKRMGTAWLRGLLEKEGGPLILDAGAGGAAIMAFRELLRAEWDTLHDQDGDDAAVREGQQKRGPIGRATVVTGSDSLRFKASSLLENTTFIPRLPDHVITAEVESNVQQPRKRYDVIIASHALWPLTEEHERRARTNALWSLLNPEGGLLILIEKGVPRGFEVIAAARDLLLRTHIASPGPESLGTPSQDQGRSIEDVEANKEQHRLKEKGCIVAPCTNHVQCPLYSVSGVSRGRKDWCYFQQRYTRPSYLMSVLQAKARNHDDVEFSYLAVQRGVDLRRPEDDRNAGQGFEQGDVATAKARKGYGSKDRHQNGNEADQGLDKHTKTEEDNSSANEIQQPHPLTLPRILPAPLKRKGHILLDVCTPSGTYERWMVRRGLGKQAFRDARKAKWGDLWALGASATEARRVKLGTPLEVVRVTSKRERERAKGWRKGRDGGKAKWQYGGSAEGLTSSDGR